MNLHPDKARTLLADLAGVRAYLLGLPPSLHSENEWHHAIQTVDTVSSLVADNLPTPENEE